VEDVEGGNEEELIGASGVASDFFSLSSSRAILFFLVVEQLEGIALSFSLFHCIGVCAFLSPFCCSY
jgi:hypothetical protein